MIGIRGFLLNKQVVVFTSIQKEYEIVRFDEDSVRMGYVRKRVTEW
jgi:hypothetical protein